MTSRQDRSSTSRFLGVGGAVIGVLACLLAAGCDDTTPAAPCDSVYPEAPTDAGARVHVSATCAASAPDGSEAAPYRSIQAAIDAAAPGSAVLVAAGEYAENLVISKPLQLIGGPADDAELAGIILHAPDPTAVAISETTDVRLRGVAIEAPTGEGIRVHRSEAVTIEACRVTGARDGGDAGAGFGVVATESRGIILHRSAIVGAEAIGIILHRTAGVVSESEIAENLLGGLSVELCYQGACDDEADAVEIAANSVTANHGFGVRLLSARGIILHNVVRQTLVGPGGAGDGIQVADARDADGESLGPARFEITADATAPDATAIR